MSTATAPQHLERYLGPSRFNWEVNEHLSILHFLHEPMEDGSSLVTQTTPPVLLDVPGEELQLYQEFLLVAPTSEDVDPLAKWLAAFHEKLMENPGLVPYGLVISTGSPVVSGTDKTAWLVAPPMYHDQGFALDQSTTPATLYLWLVPITTAEADYAKKHGSEALEEKITAAQPDMTDIRRPCLILGI